MPLWTALKQKLQNIKLYTISNMEKIYYPRLGKNYTTMACDLILEKLASTDKAYITTGEAIELLNKHCLKNNIKCNTRSAVQRALHILEYNVKITKSSQIGTYIKVGYHGKKR